MRKVITRVAPQGAELEALIARAEASRLSGVNEIDEELKRRKTSLESNSSCQPKKRRDELDDINNKPKKMFYDSIEVQCNACLTWRKLDLSTDVGALPLEWKCLDGSFECQELPALKPNTVEKDIRETESIEEDPHVPIDEVACLEVCDRYPPGSLVLVQMAGRPLWPALVEGDANHLTHFALEELPDLSEIENADEENPDGIDDDDYYHGPLLPIGYHVTLLGDPVHRLWVKTQKMNNIQSQDTPINISRYSLEVQKRWNTAIAQMRYLEDSCTPSERVEKFGYMTRYKGTVKDEPNFEASDTNWDVASGSSTSFSMPVYLTMTEEDKEFAKMDTVRYLPGDYYFPPVVDAPPMKHGADLEFGHVVKKEPTDSIGNVAPGESLEDGSFAWGGIRNDGCDHDDEADDDYKVDQSSESSDDEVPNNEREPEETDDFETHDAAEE